MARTIRTAGLIVAAGMARRMGQAKPLMEIGGRSMISRQVANFESAGVDPIVVVTGYEADRLGDHLKSFDVVCLRNDDYATTEMIDSVKIGLKWLEGQCDRVLFSPADVPLFTRRTVLAMLQSDAEVAVPTVDGDKGHPLLLDASLIPAILADGGEGGLRGVLYRLGKTTSFVETEDLGTLIDIDTPDDYADVVRHHDEQLLRPQVNIALAKTQPFFNQTSWRLLSLIETTGSVVEACEKMHMSYSKGWQLIRAMEGEMGTVLVDRKQGGKTGGSSSLTSDGKRLVARFERLTREARRAVERVFHDIFNDEDETDV